MLSDFSGRLSYNRNMLWPFTARLQGQRFPRHGTLGQVRGRVFSLLSRCLESSQGQGILSLALVSDLESN